MHSLIATRGAVSRWNVKRNSLIYLKFYLLHCIENKNIAMMFYYFKENLLEPQLAITLFK